jgi:hypothetical protein
MSDAVDQLIVIGLILIILWMLHALADGPVTGKEGKPSEIPSPEKK